MSPMTTTKEVLEFSNNRYGTEKFEGSLEELAAKFIEVTKGDTKQNCWFWMAKIVRQNTRNKSNSVAIVANMFLIAMCYGLKNPKIRVKFADARYTFKLSKYGNVYLIVNPYRNGELVEAFDYVGRFTNGAWEASRDRTPTENDLNFLRRFEQDGTEFLAQCSKDTNYCCYCNRTLDDPKSKMAGYGKTCAKKWGLPYGSEEALNKAPLHAILQEKCADILARMRNGQDDNAFAELNAFVLEEGLPALAGKPDRIVR